MDIQSLLRPEVAELDPYTPIQPFEVLSERLGVPASEIIKLDANENPYGPVPAVIEALAEYPYYHIYPDPQQGELRAALGDYVGVPAANILPSHGADEMLDYLCRLFLEPGDAIVNCPPTFGMYSFDASLVGATVIDVWRHSDYSVDVPAIERLFREGPLPGSSSGPGPRIKLIFLTSPNNPSGNWLADDDLHRLLALPALVALDEAYVEFADYPSRASWVLERDNLVVLRTFSKAAGIAGLRLGYGVCPPWLMDQLWKFKQPYNVNVAATVAGLASLRHVDQIRATVDKLKEERALLFAGLAQIPYLDPQPSQANFILCRVIGRDAAGVKRELEQRGVLVRYYRKPGLDNCIRISVGRPVETERVLTLLMELADKSEWTPMQNSI
jgi:histidinol-phosphate aminotransferase